MQIDDWRERIDAVDLKILELLNERARYSLEIGKIKHRLNLPIYVPERERAIYATLERANPGPLTGAAVRRLFERIIDESRRLEKDNHAEADSAQVDFDGTAGQDSNALQTTKPKEK